MTADEPLIKQRPMKREGHKVFISRELRELVRENPEAALVEAFRQGAYDGGQEANEKWAKEASRPGGVVKWRRIPSRGFDKTRRRKMSAEVVKR